MKKIKNQTTSAINISDVGVTIPASGEYIIPPTEYLLWVSSDDIITEIDNENVIINDGVNDLSVIEGKNYLKYPDESKNIRFDNSSNDFEAETNQAAIEEVSTKLKNEHSCGWYNVPTNSEYIVNKNKIVSTSKFEKQSGYIKHSGFIKGDR